MENSPFLKHLRNALNHLYDLDYLRQSPLVAMLKLSDRFDPPGALQKIFLDTIESLRPGPGEARLSEKRKLYEILNLRYIQQFKQNEVAHHIGLSERQFRREQDHALDVLLSVLGKKFEIGPVESITSPTQAETAGQLTFDDWNWLNETRSERTTNLETMLAETLSMMETVALRHNAGLTRVISANLPDLVIHPVAFRQVVLNLVQVAILHASHGEVIVTGQVTEHHFLLHFQSRAAQPALPAQANGQEENLLKISTHLAQLCSCRLQITQSASAFDATLSIPVVDSIPVLAVDDNPEILELLARFCQGTRYQVHGTSQVNDVIELAVSLKAQIIVLDVMMPHRDGWEILGRIRSHPLTAGIPVIILTILAQEELALSLGAHYLVMKPVAQERFLAALDAVYSSTYLSSH